MDKKNPTKICVKKRIYEPKGDTLADDNQCGETAL